MADQISLRPGDEFLSAIAGLMAKAEYDRAIELAEHSLRTPGLQRDAACALAAIAFRNDQFTNAIQLLEMARDDANTTSDVSEALAVLNCLVGRTSEAVYYAKVASMATRDNQILPLFGPDFPAFASAFETAPRKPLYLRARADLNNGQIECAIGWLEQHLALFPSDVEGLDAYSDALCQVGRASEAIGVLRSVLTLAGPSATLYCRLGRCLTDMGEFDQALASHAEALARAPKAPPLYAAILRDLARHSESAAPLRARVAAALDSAQADTAPKTVRRAPVATVKPKLCVGYLCAGDLSGETRDMLSRINLAHDRRNVTTVGFGYGDLSQSTNLSYRGAFDRWVNVTPLDELTLSVMIRGEGIDVLVDADGLLSPSRRGLFARNCAPVQLSWLNTPDGVATPGAHGSLVGNAALSVGPLLLSAAATSPAPVRPDRPTAFVADVLGSELNGEVVRVWSAILHAVPDSTLALLDRGHSEPAATEKLINLFGNFGVAHRIDVVGGQSEAQFFADGDIALAPFPAVRANSYGFALSQGLPVIAMEQGQSTLLAHAITASGFTAARMVAGSTADYVAKAKGWAEDSAGLATERANAGAVVKNSPVFNAAKFAEGLEAFYRQQLADKAQA